ncbi:hypothetical protein CCMSSC00406_0008906 [Pleurotus cornucopiae]|uniref:Uncharacterized protein n=1 Tax=Pleurotus cornucopiae TaxID=5321 RepID=A0ACB7IUP6_PLECO|nr:hypothetical protein CCMSSC00406_0008906 [Pleurotus cornucopiae]
MKGGFIVYPAAFTSKSTKELRTSSFIKMSQDIGHALVRNHEYYLPGGDLHLLADGQLFRVHKYFFQRESEWFRDQIATPVTRGNRPRGTSDSDAIPVPVRSSDLEKFLWVFYNPTYNLHACLATDWIVILGLAHQWGFDEVKRLVIRQLESVQIRLVDRIALYTAHGVDDEELRKYYSELCLRPEPIMLHEGMKLSMYVVIMVATVRERLRERRGGTLDAEIVGTEIDQYRMIVTPLDDQVTTTENADAGGKLSGGSARHPATNGTLRGRRWD